jgi:uncharacterized protein DUF87/type IV secretion system coupling TraD/TrwB family protein
LFATPYIYTVAEENGWRASAAYRLGSIHPFQPGSADEHVADEIARLQRNSAQLLRSISRQTEPARLELSYTAFPSHQAECSPLMQVHLALHVGGPSRELAVERALRLSVSLGPMLETLWDGAEFEPVGEAAKFGVFSRPFEMVGAVSIGRRSSRISVGEGLPAPAGGFGYLGRSQELAPPVLKNPSVELVLPWAPAGDTWMNILGLLLRQPVSSRAVVRIDNQPSVEAYRRRIEAELARCESYCNCPPSGEVPFLRRAAALRDFLFERLIELDGGAVRCCVLLFAPGRVDELAGDVLGHAISANWTARSDGLFRGGHSTTRLPAVGKALECDWFPDSDPFTCEEAACAFRLPLPAETESAGLPTARRRTLPFSAAGQKPDSIALGANLHRQRKTPVRLDVKDWLRHTLLLGQTGTGKSTLMLSVALQHLRSAERRGLCLVDPHGDLVDSLLERFPENRADDLILLDMEDRERPLPWNLLHWDSHDERDLIADELLRSLFRIYPDHQMFGPIFETNFRGMLKLLMGSRKRGDGEFTILELPRLYLHEPFRKRLADKCDDEEVCDFLAELERVTGENSLRNLAPYVTNKFGRFVHDSLLKRMFGHGGTAIDIGRVLEEGKVLLVRASMGRFGKLVTDLLTGQIVARFRLSALQRASMPAAERKPFFLMVDEFQHLADESFSQLLSESRKYGLALVMANQYLDQLRNNNAATSVASAVLGNVGTVVSFRLGMEDAATVASIYQPWVDATDLVQSPNWQGYVRATQNDGTVRPFSFQTVPDKTPVRPEWAEELKRRSRERYGVPAEECDRRIRERNAAIKALP